MVSGYEGAMVLASETHHRSRRARQPSETLMNSPTRLPTVRIGAPLADFVGRTRQIVAPFAAAANDGDFYRNPLWIVTGGLASSVRRSGVPGDVRLATLPRDAYHEARCAIPRCLQRPCARAL